MVFPLWPRMTLGDDDLYTLEFALYPEAIV
jgi:hypothetical protein